MRAHPVVLLTTHTPLVSLTGMSFSSNRQVIFEQSLSMIQYIHHQIEQGDVKSVDALFERYQSVFPEKFEGNHYAELCMTPLIDVLIRLNRRELLANMIVATIPEDENNKSEVENLALRSGVVLAKHDPESFSHFKGLLPESLQEKAQEGFNHIKEHQAKD